MVFIFFIATISGVLRSIVNWLILLAKLVRFYKQPENHFLFLTPVAALMYKK